jgi:hypothetical protein
MTNPKNQMTDIRTSPYITNTLTIRKLKEILSVLPDTNEYGDDYEVWVGSQNDFSSSSVASVWALNKTDNGCDIILEARK